MLQREEAGKYSQPVSMGSAAREPLAAALSAWLRECPIIGRETLPGVDFLGEEAGAWALSEAPGEVKYRENILGKTTRLTAQSRYFHLALRAPYGADAAQNLENLAALEAVTEWIWAQNALGRLPEWSGGCMAAVLPATPPVRVSASGGDARYELGLRCEIRQ